MKTKKIIAMLLSVMLVMGCMTSVVYAESLPAESNLIGLVEVNENARDGYTPTLGWNVANSGTYFFEGSSSRATLFTLYYFTGAEKYYVKVYNEQSSGQKVKLRTIGNESKFAEYTVPGNGELGFWVTQSEAWYIEFTGGWLSDGSDVQGYVSLSPAS